MIFLSLFRVFRFFPSFRAISCLFFIYISFLIVLGKLLTFRFPELPLSPRVDSNADYAMTYRFLRISRGRFVKAKGGIYKGQMVGIDLSGLLSILFF